MRLPFILCLALLTGSVQAHDNQAQRYLKVTVGTTLVAGTTYICSKMWGSWVVYHARMQFGPQRELLNQYGAKYAHAWSQEIERQLRNDMKANIVYWHNCSRDRRWPAIGYDIAQGRSGVYVQENWYRYPLLQYMADLNYYVCRLKWISTLHLYSNRDELHSLIEQLEYIKSMLHSDHGYSSEEQRYFR